MYYLVMSNDENIDNYRYVGTWILNIHIGYIRNITNILIQKIVKK